MKSAFEQFSKMSRVCSTIVFIERIRERQGILVALIPELGIPVLPEVAQQSDAGDIFT